MANTNDLAQLIAEAADAKAAFNKDSVIGATVTGDIAAISVRQVRDFKTNAPQTWDDGSPMLNIVLTLDNAAPVTDEDNGKRAVYVKWWGEWRKNFARAVTNAGVPQPEIGGKLTATFVSVTPSDDPKLSDTHNFEYQYIPASANPGTADTPTETPAA